MNHKIKRAIEVANERDVGQFHVFNGDIYHSTWRTLKVSEVIARKQKDGAVYNMDGTKAA